MLFRSLDRLYEYRNRPLGARRLDLLDIAVRNYDKSAGKGAEAGTRRLFGRKSDDGDGTTVEVFTADDYLRFIPGDASCLVSPFAYHLDRRFYGLGTAVHGKHFVGVGGFRQLPVEECELVVTERPGGKGEAGRLLHHGLIDLGVAVSLVHRGVGGETIEVPLAFNVPDPDTLASLQYYIQGLVVVRPESVFEVDELLSSNCCLLAADTSRIL